MGQVKNIVSTLLDAAEDLIRTLDSAIEAHALHGPLRPKLVFGGRAWADVEKLFKAYVPAVRWHPWGYELELNVDLLAEGKVAKNSGIRLTAEVRRTPLGGVVGAVLVGFVDWHLGGAQVVLGGPGPTESFPHLLAYLVGCPEYQPSGGEK